MEKKSLWFYIRGVMAAVFSVFSMLFGFIMIGSISILQLLFLSKKNWVNPFTLWKTENFDSVYCVVICGMATFIIVFIHNIQEAMEEEFCVLIDEDNKEK